MRAAAVVMALCLLAARAGNAAEDPAANRVLIRNFMFEPMAITIKAGSSVVWLNQDDEPHTVVSDEGLFRSGGLDTDMSFTFKFEKAGTYHVICSIHPQMTATITVE